MKGFLATSGDKQATVDALASIPTLSEWALLVLVTLMAGIGLASQP